MKGSTWESHGGYLPEDLEAFWRGIKGINKEHAAGTIVWTSSHDDLMMAVAGKGEAVVIRSASDLMWCLIQKRLPVIDLCEEK